MEKILNFIDDYTMESQLYYRVTSLYDQKVFELQWFREKNSGVRKAAKPWRVRPLGDDSWAELATAELVNVLNEFQIDLLSFEQMVSTSVLQQIVYADMVTKKAEALFGRPAIDEAIDANQKFMEELAETLKSLVKAVPEKKEAQKSDKPSLKVIHQSE